MLIVSLVGFTILKFVSLCIVGLGVFIGGAILIIKVLGLKTSEEIEYMKLDPKERWTRICIGLSTNDPEITKLDYYLRDSNNTSGSFEFDGIKRSVFGGFQSYVFHKVVYGLDRGAFSEYFGSIGWKDPNRSCIKFQDV